MLLDGTLLQNRPVDGIPGFDERLKILYGGTFFNRFWQDDRELEHKEQDNNGRSKLQLPSGSTEDVFTIAEEWNGHEIEFPENTDNYYTIDEVVDSQTIWVIGDTSNVSGSKVWKDSKRVLPRKSVVQNTVTARDPSIRVCNDIEVWTPEQNATRFPTILAWQREANPDLNLGFYSVERGWYSAANYFKNKSESNTQQLEDDVSGRIQLLVNAEYKPDTVYPSLYVMVGTYDSVKYKQVSYWNVQPQRNLNVPVFPFVWWKHHNSSTSPDQYLGDSNWYDVVFRATSLTGNCVVWGGWQQDYSDWSSEMSVAVQAYNDAKAIQNKWDQPGPVSY